MTYAITGASGQLGRLAAERLLETVDPAEVVLLTRDPAKLADHAARGAEVRAADFESSVDELAAAFTGVDKLLLISTGVVGAARVAGQRTAIDAAKAAGVGLVAYTSVPRPSADNPALAAHDHFATEEYLRASGLNWIMLRNNLYADMQPATIARAAESGKLVTNNGTGRVAYVTRADCADAAVGALTGDAVDVAYDVTGPQALDSSDLAALAGPDVEVVDVDDAGFTAGLVGAGLPQPVADVVATFGTATRQGLLADVSTAVRDLTGREPAPLNSLLD